MATKLRRNSGVATEQNRLREVTKAAKRARNTGAVPEQSRIKEVPRTHITGVSEYLIHSFYCVLHLIRILIYIYELHPEIYPYMLQHSPVRG